MLRQMTSYGQFRRHVKPHLFQACESLLIVTLEVFLRYTDTLSYLLIDAGRNTRARSVESASRTRVC